MSHARLKCAAFTAFALVFGLWINGSVFPQERLGQYIINDCRILQAEGEHRNPVAKIYRIKGVKVEPADRAIRGKTKLIEFTRRVMKANPKLSLDRFSTLSEPKVRFHGTGTTVDYKQEAILSDGSTVPVFMSEIRFFINSRNELSFIGNQTYRLSKLGPASLTPDDAEQIALETITQVPIQITDGSGSPDVPAGLNDGGLASRTEMVPFLAEEAEIKELGVYGKADDGPHLAYQIVVKGIVNGGVESYAAYIDAHRGDLLKYFSLQIKAMDQKGWVETFDPNPTQNPTVLTMPIYKLDSSYKNLYGAWAEVHNSTYGDATDSKYEFFYSTAPFPESEHMTEAQVYYQNDRIVRETVAIGFPGLLDSPQYIDAYDTATPYDHYDVDTFEVHMMGAPVRPHAYDTDIFGHEYFGHAKHHFIGGTGHNGYPFDLNLDGNQAMDEGLSDYSATSFLNNRDWAEYVAGGYGLPFRRTLNSDYNVVDHTGGGDPHLWGISFGAGFWDLYERLGKVIATQISIQMVYYILPTDDFDAALESCIIQADNDLNGGIYEDILRRVFSIRKIYGTAGSYPWTFSFPMSTSRPYTDNEDDTQTYTIPGATALNVTFDAYTRIYYANETYTDYLYIMDGSDIEIPGSPFVARELQNKTVQVPGNTVKIRLWSIPDNNRTSAGYRVINICEVDPSNQTPVAQVSPSINSGMEPLVVTFDTSSSYDPDGTILCRTLDPGDGSPPVQFDSNTDVVHVYDRDGVGPITETTIFNATLTVTDSKGDTDTIIVPITVTPWEENIHVPGQYATIQSAINAAYSDQKILVGPGTYTENLDFLGKTLTLKSTDGAVKTVLDGGQAGSVIIFQGTEGPYTTIEGFSITNGIGTLESSSTYGGGILCKTGACPIIVNCVVHGNSADYGAGIFCGEDADAVLTNDTIYGNTAFLEGGGVACPLASPIMTNCILWNNTAPAGAQIQGTPAVTYCDVQGGFTGTGNIDADPEFKAPGADDFHLTRLSPCIEAGDNSAQSLPKKDMEGDSRVFPGNGKGMILIGSPPPPPVVDMGADEYCKLKFMKFVPK